MNKTLTLAALLALGLCFPTQASAESPKTLEYQGKLKNSKLRPIAGVFPLKFALYRGPKGGKPVWSETHFVAVDSGRYVVTLGKKKRLGRRLDPNKLFLGVAQVGGAESERERISLTPNDPTPVDMRARKRTQPKGTTAAPVRTQNGRTTVDYAEEAGLATFAHTAETAKSIGGLTEKDLMQRLDATGGAKVKLGTRTRNSISVGGGGGSEYDLVCPKGSVVTGLRGTAGIYLDSIQLICTPLE